MKMKEVKIPESYFNKEKRTKKVILAISDIPLAATGVAVQFNQLITYLIGTGEFQFYVIGGAVKHPDMDVKVLNDDFILEPCVGQGNKDVVKARLTDLQPDAVFIFTDPHQYVYLWEMADEVHQVCPILYWHVWDNDPYPDCNTVWYQGTDFIGTISQLTHGLVSSKFPEKTKYIPHTFAPNLYFPLPQESKRRASEFFYKERVDHYKMLWVNRNGHRKQLNELLPTFKMFLDWLEKKEGHRNSTLLLRTEIHDPEGPNVQANINALQLQDNVIMIDEKLDYPLMNILYNSADLNLNISKAEGFGLTLLTAMNTKTLCAGVMTGGMKEQLVDPVTGEKFGIPIKVHHRNLVGSQLVPYIYEDYASREDILAAMIQAYSMSEEDREEIVEKAYNRAKTFFGYEKIMNTWREAFHEEIKKYQENKLGKNQWTLSEIAIDSKKEKALKQMQITQIEEQKRMMMLQQQHQVQQPMQNKATEDLIKKILNKKTEISVSQ
jgi:glycosyltransferase involved in cell wall biosynthesis